MNPDRLHGLKQIAAHLGHDEKWCRRWASAKGKRRLPIMREGGRWTASKAELDAWRSPAHEGALKNLSDALADLGAKLEQANRRIAELATTVSALVEHFAAQGGMGQKRANAGVG